MLTCDIADFRQVFDIIYVFLSIYVFLNLIKLIMIFIFVLS